MTIEERAKNLPGVIIENYRQAAIYDGNAVFVVNGHNDDRIELLQSLIFAIVQHNMEK